MLGVIGIMPFIAHASTVLQSGDKIVLDATKEVRGNFYAAGGTVSVSGVVHGDAYLTGGTVSVTAPIKGDLGIIAGTIRIDAPVYGDLRVAGSDIVIGNSVTGELIVMGGTVHILPTAEIKGDIIVYGGTVTVEGPIGGSIFGTVGELELAGKVAGSVLLKEVDTLTLRATAQILGTLEYTSISEAVLANGAKVIGETLRHEEAPLSTDMADIVFLLITSCVFVLVAMVLFRKQLPDLVSRTAHHARLYALIGAGVFIATPVVTVLLLISGIALPVGLFIGSAYIALLVASLALLAHVLGSYLIRGFTRKLEVTWVTAFAGALILLTLYFVPILLVLAIIVPLGTLSREIYVTFFSGIQLHRKK